MKDMMLSRRFAQLNKFITETSRSVWSFVRSWALYPVPKYTRWGLYPQAVILLGCSFVFQWWPPIPTVAMGILGVVAAIMTVRADRFTNVERLVYVIMAFALFIVEMQAVLKDRKEYVREQAELRVREDEARAKEAQAFARVLTKDAVILDTARQVQVLTRQNLENVTGGQSYAAVTPQVWSGLVPIPLSIYNYGKQTLTGVTVTIRGQQAWDFIKNPYSMYQAEASAVNVGTLHPRELKVLAQTITPVTKDATLFDHYQLDIAAQNFTVTEDLLFKKGVKVPWDFKYIVVLQYIKSQTKKETKFGYHTLAQTDWTGD